VPAWFRGRRPWRLAVAQTGPLTRPQRTNGQRIRAAIGAAPSSGPPTAAATVNRPPSAPHSRDLAAWLARLERASG
jgi:hypothetical protein